MKKVSCQVNIVDTRWTSHVNIHMMKCQRCGMYFEHPANRWIVSCPRCGVRESLDRLREAFVQEQKVRRWKDEARRDYSRN